MKVTEYTVTYREQTDEPQQRKKFYIAHMAKAFAAGIELWGGVTIITDKQVEEADVDKKIWEENYGKR